MNVLEYKGYWAVIQYSVEDQCLFGKVEGIDDLVSFGSESALDIVQRFHEAVDEYLEDCKRHNKEPNKAYKGSFNVRLTPELHRAIAVASLQRGTTLNQFMVSAAEHELQNRELA